MTNYTIRWKRKKLKQTDYMLNICKKPESTTVMFRKFDLTKLSIQFNEFILVVGIYLILYIYVNVTEQQGRMFNSR